MYDFNLLPKAKQKNTRQWVMKQQLIMGLILVNGVLLAMCGTLGILHFSLQKILIASANEVSIVHNNSTDAQSDSQDTQYINNRIQQLHSIQQEHPNYLGLLQEISTLLPAGVSVRSLNIDYTKNLLTIDGFAAERSNLQALQHQIEADDRFLITQFPFDALTVPKEIPFTIELTFTPKDFQYQTYE